MSTQISDRQLLWNALFQSGGLNFLDAAALDRLVLLAEDQEVLLPLAEQFLAAPNTTELVAERVALRRGNHEKLAEQLTQVDACLRAAEVPYLMIKGFGYERLQAPGYSRQMDDLDLVLPTVADGWRAMTALAELGYQLLAATVARKAWGWASVLVVQNADGSDLELNCAGMIFHSHSVLPWDDQLWDDQETARGVGVPGRRWAAAILIAEMLDRPRLRLRDRLDARAVLARLDKSDQAWLADLARRYALGWELAAARDTGSDDVDFEGRRALRLRRRAPRTFRAVTHAFPAMRQEGLSQAVRAASIALVRDSMGSWLEDDPDTVDNLSDRTLAWAGRLAKVLNHRPASRQLAAGISLPLIPLDVEDSSDRTSDNPDGITVYDKGRMLVLDTPIGGFLATVVPVIDEDQLDEATEILRSRTHP
jgi:hypothetical protein